MPTFPQHRSPANNAPRATAPYNFVPLPERVLLPELESKPFTQHDRWLDERHHGTIDLTLTTVTPTYTRCAYAPELAESPVPACPDKQHFYHHGSPDSPVIPGSSIRGMIRSLVEILSYSRISRRPERGKATRIRNERLVYRAVAEPGSPDADEYRDHWTKNEVKAGFLERSGNDWQVRPAATTTGTPNGYVRVAANLVPGGLATPTNRVVPVWLDITTAGEVQSVSATAGATLQPAHLVLSNAPNRTKYTAVLEPDSSAPPLDIPPDVWKAYERDRDLHRDPARMPRKMGRPGAARPEACFYIERGGQIYFLGPTLYFRLPYERFTADFVPQSTMGATGLDLAEAMFGTVNRGKRGEGDGGAHKSRVSFEDATLQSAPHGGPFLEQGPAGLRQPSPLMSPKPTSYQMYLVQPNGHSGQKRDLLGYTATPGQTAIRGHKRYWHRGQPDARDLGMRLPAADDKLATVIRPVRAEVAFAGRIRFENLTDLELGALLAALELPDSCRHQLGLGKPLGLGTVKLECKVRLRDPQAHYRALAAAPQPSDAERRIRKARETFASTMLRHHADSTSSTLSHSATLWSIPRLAALQALLTYPHDASDFRQRTATMNAVAGAFRSRPVLPTPQAVLGGKDPDPTSATWPDELTPQQQQDPRQPAPQRPPADATAVPTREVRGTIALFRRNPGPLLSLEGVQGRLHAILNTDVFPVEVWRSLDGNSIRVGRRIRAQIRDAANGAGQPIVTRVVPDP